MTTTDEAQRAAEEYAKPLIQTAQQRDSTIEDFIAGFHAGAAKGARTLYERLYKEMEFYGCTGCEEDPPMVALAHIKKVVEKEFSLPPSPKREGE